MGYLLAIVLSQQVNFFGLSITKEKLKAIAKLFFSTTLKALKHYLGLTSYLWNYIPRYVAKAKPLQDRKTQLLKRALTSRPPHQTFATKEAFVYPIGIECASFATLQYNLTLY